MTKSFAMVMCVSLCFSWAAEAEPMRPIGDELIGSALSALSANLPESDLKEGEDSTFYGYTRCSALFYILGTAPGPDKEVTEQVSKEFGTAALYHLMISDLRLDIINLENKMHGIQVETPTGTMDVAECEELVYQRISEHVAAYSAHFGILSKDSLTDINDDPVLEYDTDYCTQTFSHVMREKRRRENAVAQSEK